MPRKVFKIETEIAFDYDDESRPPTADGVVGLVITALSVLGDDLNDYQDRRNNLDTITKHWIGTTVVTEGGA